MCRYAARLYPGSGGDDCGGCEGGAFTKEGDSAHYDGIVGPG